MRWASPRLRKGWRFLLIMAFLLFLPSAALLPGGAAASGPAVADRLPAGISFLPALHLSVELQTDFIARLTQDSSDEPTGTPFQEASPSGTTAIPPILTATPAADGSIVHVVEPGQVLLNIAAAYQINLGELYALNSLNADSVIYPGDKIIIRTANLTLSAVPTETTLPTTPPPAPTHRPTRTPTQTAAAAAIQNKETAIPVMPVGVVPLDVNRLGRGDPLLIAIGALAFLGASLVIFGSLLKRRT